MNSSFAAHAAFPQLHSNIRPHGPRCGTTHLPSLASDCLTRSAWCPLIAVVFLSSKTGFVKFFCTLKPQVGSIPPLQTDLHQRLIFQSIPLFLTWSIEGASQIITSPQAQFLLLIFGSLPSHAVLVPVPLVLLPSVPTSEDYTALIFSFNHNLN